MNHDDVAQASRLPANGVQAGRLRYLSPPQCSHLVFITLGAVAIFVALRLLPTGTNLSHMDFRVDGSAKNSLEFCDPLNPQFIPVMAVPSPVTMTIRTETPPAAGREVAGVVVLRTASGKQIVPEDLLLAHTKKLHLLIVDPSLTDYQHVHPAPSKKPGEWSFSFTPRFGGSYRVFGDFTPAATARGLWASADLDVDGQRPPAAAEAGAATLEATAPGGRRPPLVGNRDGFEFRLTPGSAVLRASKTIDLQFSIVRADGGEVPMEPVMGAFAHLVAFDETRSGFAHLHPMEIDVTKRPDTTRPVLNFKVTIPRAGRYVIWAQVNLGGREMFVPFWFDVAA